MARTYRRNKPKSQNKTAHYIKNLCVALKHDDGYYFPFVNFKRDKRFFTDNQKTSNWKFETDLMNRRNRYDARKSLRKVVNGILETDEVVLDFKEKAQMAKEIYYYWD